MDERLVMPGTRYEIIDGKVVYVPPADEPHGTCHTKLSALLLSHAAESYTVALDMLTRTSEKGDMAPDASVFPTARDATTGGRRLEELAFEIASSERLSHIAKKARALTGRGVRRVFALDLRKHRTLEWSVAKADWQLLAPGTTIEDPALSVPLPVDALIDTAKADDAVAAALLARKNPVVEGAIHEAEARGAVAGKMAALLAILSVKGIRVPKDMERRLRARAEQDPTALDTWLRRCVQASTLEEMLRSD